MAESMADCIGGSIEMPSLSSGDRSSSKNVKIRFTIFTAIFRAQGRPEPTAAVAPGMFWLSDTDGVIGRAMSTDHAAHAKARQLRRSNRHR
jgi:hypothetical protein